MVWRLENIARIVRAMKQVHYRYNVERMASVYVSLELEGNIVTSVNQDILDSMKMDAKV